MLFIKKYILPIFFSAGIFAIVAILFTDTEYSYFPGIIIAFLFSYLIRVCDDISDYENDCKTGKVFFKMPALIFIKSAVVIGLICISILFSLYLLFIPLAVICLSVLMKKQYSDFIKPLYIPIILLILVNTVFEYSHIVILLIVVAVIIDIAIIIRKRKKGV